LPGRGEERYGTDFVTTWGGVANTARIGASLGARVQLVGLVTQFPPSSWPARCHTPGSSSPGAWLHDAADAGIPVIADHGFEEGYEPGLLDAVSGCTCYTPNAAEGVDRVYVHRRNVNLLAGTRIHADDPVTTTGDDNHWGGGYCRLASARNCRTTHT
jgi:hypothetical protein